MDRNLILALVLSMLTFFVWDTFINQPQQEQFREYQEEQERQRKALADENGTSESLGNEAPGSEALGGVVTRDKALALAPGRVEIETPSFTGSINLTGARIDDLKLKNYRETVDESSPIVTLFSPRESQHAYYLQPGMKTQIRGQQTQNNRTAVWQAEDGAKLTPTTPVTLSLEQDGLLREMQISVDENYMFSVTQKITNNTGLDIAVAPEALAIQRSRELPTSTPQKRNQQGGFILHEGPISIVGDKLYDRKYGKVYDKPNIAETGVGGWVGLTSKYWMAAAIPAQDVQFKTDLGRDPNSTEANPLYMATYTLDAATVAPGETYTTSSHLFAGAKRVQVLRAYENDLGISKFDKAVDWGMFSFITRPIYWLLNWFGTFTGNYGIAILLLTIVVKAVLFPLANKSYASMAEMRKVQPDMVRIRERYADDKVKQQQEMMELYKKHKINPMAGCLPILIQMPVFFALYKVLFISLEIRHESFLYIQDMSAPDPAMLFNLFGLIPWDPSSVPVIGSFISIGLLPLLMGAAMWVQMKLNPPPQDPIQAQVFAFMPLIFMFIFAPFAAGLVLYWFWNTFLGVIQQYYIMKRHGTDVDLLGNIKNAFSRKKPEVTAGNDNK
jgi:YidC/Oxa1 family membrane protein insertase